MSVYVGAIGPRTITMSHLMNLAGREPRSEAAREGMTALHELLRQEPAEVVIGMRPSAVRGSRRSSAQATGFTLNPRAASRYRQRRCAHARQPRPHRPPQPPRGRRRQRGAGRCGAHSSSSGTARARALRNALRSTFRPRSAPSPPHAPRCALGALRGGSAQHDAAPLCTAPGGAQRGAAGCGDSGSAARPHAPAVSEAFADARRGGRPDPGDQPPARGAGGEAGVF